MGRHAIYILFSADSQKLKQAQESLGEEETRENLPRLTTIHPNHMGSRFPDVRLKRALPSVRAPLKQGPSP